MCFTLLSVQRFWTEIHMWHWHKAYTHISLTYTLTYLQDSFTNCKTFTIPIIRIAATCIYPAQPVCTSLFILLVIKSQYTVLCTSYLFCTFLFYCTFYSLFLLFYLCLYICSCVVTFFSFFALSTERTWLDLRSLLIIPCIIVVCDEINKNLEPWSLRRLKHSLP